MYIFRVPSKSLPLPSLSVFTGKSASSAPSGSSGSDGTDASSSADSDGSSANSEMPTCNSDREDSSSSSDSDRGPGPAGPSVADSLKPAHKAVLQASKDWYRPRSDTKLPKQVWVATPRTSTRADYQILRNLLPVSLNNFGLYFVVSHAAL